LGRASFNKGLQDFHPTHGEEATGAAWVPQGVGRVILAV